jgi:hypothetical protein
MSRIGKKEAKSIKDFTDMVKKHGDRIIQIYRFMSSELLYDHSDPKEFIPEHEPGIEKNVWIRLESENFCYETSPDFRSKPIFKKSKRPEAYDARKPEDRLQMMGELLRRYFIDEGFSVIYHEVKKVQGKPHKDVPDEDLILIINLAEKYGSEI